MVDIAGINIMMLGREARVQYSLFAKASGAGSSEVTIGFATIGLSGSTLSPAKWKGDRIDAIESIDIYTEQQIGTDPKTGDPIYELIYAYTDILVLMDSDTNPQNFFKSITINGYTFYTASASLFTTAGGSSRWRWTNAVSNGIMTVNNTYTVIIEG